MKCEPSVPLSADVVYVAPSGKRCRWVPDKGERITSCATFVYVDLPSKRERRHTEAAAWHEGFRLTPQNYRLLRVAGGAR